MSFSVTMPALGESVTEGTVTRWLKQEGEQVAVDEPLLEVSTDKVDTEIPSPVAGVLSRIVVAEDETVEVGAELAVIGDEASGGAAAQDAPAESAPTEAAPAPAEPAAAESASAPAQSAPAPAAPVAQEPADSTPTPQAPEPAAQPESSAPAASTPASGTPVTMPALGESVTEGTVTRWLKRVGEQVAVDEPLLEVSTDKVDTEIPSPVAGTVLEIAVAEDETVEVGALLATIGSQDAAPAAAPEAAAPAAAAPEAAPAPAPPAAEPAPAPAAEPAPSAPAAVAPEASAPAPAEQPGTEQASPDVPAHTPAEASANPTTSYAPAAATSAPASGAPASTAPAAAASTPSESDSGVYVTPLVRKLAAEHQVDLATLTGTGVGGRVRKQDVLDAAAAAKEAAAAAAAEAAAKPPAPSEPAPGAAAPAKARTAPADMSPLRGTTEKMSRMRKVIAQRMVESLQTSAQLTTVVEVDVTRVARLRARAKNDFVAREGVKLTFLPFFAQASIEALKAHPRANASVEGDSIVYHGAENLGVAVDTDRGLLVPVIKDAGDLNIAGLARKIADLAERARGNKITPDELGGGTFTLTNTGSRGALFDTPIINQPQVAILGTGAVVKRAVVVDHPDLGETIAVRSMVYLALSYDHRIVDGADAARFLSTMKSRLEEGAFEAALGL